jgi:hypothetical protein
MDNVKQALARNWAASLSDDFVRRIVGGIYYRDVRRFRIHPSGDFYDAPYTRKWFDIASQSTMTTFWAYTRSWHIKRMRKALIALKDLPNMNLWLSCDRETHELYGRPPKWKRTRVAYMTTEYDEFVPAYADLVFRDKRKREAKYTHGRLVCPVENGVELKRKLTCDKCGICFNERQTPRYDRSLVQLEV